MCKPNLNSIMLFFGRNSLTFGRGTTCSLSIILPLWGWGHYKLESFGFWRRKFCIKNAEIFAVGKIAEFAKFAGGKRRKSPDRFSLIRATASYRRSSSWKLTLTRGRVPLSVIRVGINVSRFATRAWACGERVRYPTIFPKSLIRYLMNEG